MKKITLNEAQMREIIAESVKQVSEARDKHLLTEMAFPRSVYKRKIDEELPRILLNWCLVHYCTITGKQLSKENWKGELRGHIETSARLSIKGNDAPEKRQKVFNEVWEVFNAILSRNTDVITQYVDTV